MSPCVYAGMHAYFHEQGFHTAPDRVSCVCVLVARVNVFILPCLICTVCVCVCVCERVCVCWCGVQVLPAVTRFGGMPEVTIDGDIIYTFDDLQVPISFLHGISFFCFSNMRVCCSMS